MDMKISRRRVQQAWKIYEGRKQEPIIGENMGRPRKPFDEQEAEVVSEAYKRYRFGARMLEVVVRKCLRPVSPIIVFTCILRRQAWPMKIPRKKGDVNGFDTNESIAYLQDISIGMNSGWSDLKVCVIIDDASRMILAGGEFKNIDTENSKLVVDQLVERYWWLCPNARAHHGSWC